MCFRHFFVTCNGKALHVCKPNKFGVFKQIFKNKKISPDTGIPGGAITGHNLNLLFELRGNGRCFRAMSENYVSNIPASFSSGKAVVSFSDPGLLDSGA